MGEFHLTLFTRIYKNYTMIWSRGFEIAHDIHLSPNCVMLATAIITLAADI